MICYLELTCHVRYDLVTQVVFFVPGELQVNLQFLVVRLHFGDELIFAVGGRSSLT